MSDLETLPFSSSHVGRAAGLLAARHRAHRIAEPGLDAIYETTPVVEAAIDAILATPGASGAVGVRGGELVGFLLGAPKDDATWGPNIWVEGAGHAATEAEDIRDLYAFAAARWVETGRTNHHVIVPATDLALVDAWFSLDFGQQHVHGIREAPAADFSPTLRDGVSVRRATRDDIPLLARLELVLPTHQAASPVFSPLAVPTVEQTIEELEADFDDPRYALLVAELDGRILGSAVGCSLELSSLHAGITRPASAGFLGFAAAFPDARGLGAGRALGKSVMAWSRDAGFDWVVTDWRSTNLLASRAWPALGFRPTFRRLHRTIAESDVLRTGRSGRARPEGLSSAGCSC